MARKILLKMLGVTLSQLRFIYGCEQAVQLSGNIRHNPHVTARQKWLMICRFWD